MHLSVNSAGSDIGDTSSGGLGSGSSLTRRVRYIGISVRLRTGEFTSKSISSLILFDEGGGGGGVEVCRQAKKRFVES